jgi:tRNA dimethylallyltransferase
MAERRGIPHHLLDVLEVTEPASVAAYQRAAGQAVTAVRRRGNRPLLAGGSGLYVRAVVDELLFPGTDPGTRARLEERLRRHGAPALHAWLAGRDPTAAAAILPSNGRRIVRALEVVELTGRAFPARLPGYRPVSAVQIGLDLPLAELDRRIEARVAGMWRRGLVDEVRRLAAGLRQGPTAGRALGYRQVLELLAGRSTEEEAMAATVLATRRFARRQRSWFRRDPRVRWLAADDPHLLERALGLLESAVVPGARA